jgi:hypothetical protein
MHLQFFLALARRETQAIQYALADIAGQES